MRGEGKMFDFSRLEEKVSIEAHQNYWKDWYSEETEQLGNIFDENLFAFEHIGSSAVKRLYSKPIVDILVGLKEFAITDLQICQLENFGYEYFGQLHVDQKRFFARKRKERNFNLQIVPHSANVWNEHVAFRDYLRTHPEKVKIYSEIKKEAISLEKNNLLSYHEHKEALVKRLLLEALEWKHFNGTPEH
ncbi:MAG: hypothetical protein H6Q69_51 [Firmicutes bacterium]|nr:hypothetical protein [Bacillota bacterium]